MHGDRRERDDHALSRRQRAGDRRPAAVVPAAAQGGTGVRLDHRPGPPRLHAAAGVRAAAAGRPLDGGIRARVGRACLRPRRKVRSARQARSAGPFAGGGRARRQHGPVGQEHAARLEHRQRPRRVGRLRQHARLRRARRGPSGLVAPNLRDRRRRRGARPVPVRHRYAGGAARRLHEAHRPRAGSAAVEPRTVGVARALPVTGRRDRGGGGAARATDSLRRHRPRRPRGVEDGDAVQLPVGPGAVCRRARLARRVEGAAPQGGRLGMPVRVGARPAVRRARGARLPAEERRRRPAGVFLRHADRRPAPPATRRPRCRRPGSSTSPARPHSRGGATRTRRCSPTAST